MMNEIETQDTKIDVEATGEEDNYDIYLDYGISVKKGLEYFAGIMDVYLEIVDLFLKNSEINENKLHKFLLNGNLKDYSVLVHAVKGNARTLGADKLADLALRHETESKVGNLDYVRTHWDALTDNWRTVRNGLALLYQKYCGDRPEKYGAVESTDGKVLEITREELGRVAAWIDSFETEKAVAQLKEWIQYPLEPEIFERIRSALIALEDEYDDDRAMEILNG